MITRDIDLILGRVAVATQESKIAIWLARLKDDPRPAYFVAFDSTIASRELMKGGKKAIKKWALRQVNGPNTIARVKSLTPVGSFHKESDVEQLATVLEHGLC